MCERFSVGGQGPNLDRILFRQVYVHFYWQENILNGGSSDYPIELIKKAGIDPLSSEAFDLTMVKMNKVMDQMEEILNKKK